MIYINAFLIGIIIGMIAEMCRESYRVEEDI